MTARNIAVSQREDYSPSQFTEFLWWLSTAEREILVDSVIDRNRYRIIGMTVGGVKPQQWVATIYPGPKNNFVFNASTIFWSQGLSSPPGHTLPWSHWTRPHGPDERVQKITHNLLTRAIGGH